MNWYLAAMRNYANFDGRARRREYWFFALFNTIFAVVAMILDNVLGLTKATSGFSPLYAFYFLATLVPSLAVLVRRLHDTGKSGWYVLVAFIPFIGGIWLFILSILDSDPYENGYGPSPKDAEMSILR